MALYHGVNLDLTTFYGDKVLWIDGDPDHRLLPYMEFVGGYPNEYCVILKHLPKNELIQLVSDNQDDAELIFCCNEILQNPNSTTQLTDNQLTRLVRQIMAKYNIPKFDITVEPVKNDNIFISKIGGFPYWPSDMEYPVGENGQPLYLLAQLLFGSNSAEHEEMLQFFIADDDMYGLGHDQTDTSNFRVVYHKTIDYSVTIGDLRKRNIPSSAEINTPENTECSLPMADVGVIHYKKGTDHLSPYMRKHEDILNAEAKLLGMPSPLNYDMQEKVWDRLYTDGSRYFGLPCFTQEDPRDDNGNYNGESYSILLLQIDSIPEINLYWGDGGVCNFFINEDDLKNLDFSHVLYNWDCY